MKNILRGAVAAIALVGIATSASAQTNQRHYAGSVPLFGATYTATNPSNVPNLQVGPFVIIPSDRALAEAAVTLGIGTRYTASTTAQGDTGTASPEINVAFDLKGKVNQDCSFYAGNDSSARTIDFGTIGIRTGNNENVSNAFEMVAQAKAEIETLTAGCNTNNVVEISKNDVRGLVNQNPGGFDTNQFQANIPYYVEAKWTGVGQDVQAGGTLQTLTVNENSNAGSKSQGAWRSDMKINIVAPRVNGKGLVAGDYTGETKITLRAI